MEQRVLDWLMSTGLSEKRARIYLMVLSKGETSAGTLAQELKSGRTAVYDNLRHLEARGFIKTVHRGKRKVFVPVSPKDLYKELDRKKQRLKDLLPDLMSVFGNEGIQPFVQVLSGPYAAREVFEDLLAVTKKEYVYFSLPDESKLTIDRNFISKWVDRRVKKDIHSRSLRVRSKSKATDILFDEEKPYLRQIRYLPAYLDLKSEIYVYESSIGIITTRKEGAAFIIRSVDLAYSLRQLFEFLWRVSTP